MAALLLGGVGSAIGSSVGGTFLGMSASSLGWMIGSTLGNLLFAEKTHTYGPRLKGDRFSGSALGQVRPIVYGTCKVEGKIIWQTPYHEHEHTEDSGGKGGGSEYTSYTYTRSFAVLLCEGAIQGIRKIWINGKLEFDFSGNSNVAADLQSGTRVNNMKFYYGSDTQLADATMESFDGSGNVPAYRGTSYIVFNEYDVTESAGACPIIEVEVVSVATESTSSALGVVIAEDGLAGGIAGANNWGQIGYVNEGVLYYHVETIMPEYGRMIGVDLSSGNVVWQQSYANINTVLGNDGPQRGPFSEDAYYYYCMGTNFFDGFPGINCATVTTIAKLLDGSIASVASQFLVDDQLNYIQVASAGAWRDGGILNNFYFKRGVYQTYLYATSVDPNITDPSRWVMRWDMPERIASKRYDFADGNYHLACYPSEDGDVYVYNEHDDKIYRFDLDLNLIESRSMPVSAPTPGAIAYADGILWSLSNYNNGSSNNAVVEAYQWPELTLIGSVSDLAYGSTTRGGDRTNSLYASASSCVVTIDGKVWTVSTRRITRQSATLSDIIADLHGRAEQISADYDVAALTDDVRGYLITEQVSARSCIEQLQIGFLFDAVDSGGKIKYVKRGSASQATLTTDDLGAFENEPVSEWMVTRQQEEELPQTLSFSYMDYDGSYEKAAQNATRQAVLAGDVATFQAPIVFTANEAQSVAQKQMMAAWLARTRYKFQTNMEWAKLEPCDVVTVQDKVMRIISRNDGVNGIIEFEAVAELPSIYTNTGIGSLPSGYTEETLTARGPTLFEVMDLPPLRDADYNRYISYLAATGVLSGWPSAAIMRSIDGQAYTLASLITSASVMGYATTVLADWEGGNVPDEEGSVTVSLYGSGTLSSVTYTEMLSGDMCFLLGNEIIFGRTATLVSTGLYTITGLLRGRFGTEHEQDSHAINDRFVLLREASLRLYENPASDINAERFYKGVTSGNKISAASPKSVTYAGNSQKPWTPVQIGGGTAGVDTAWTIKWMRRSRYFNDWVDEVGVGADEASYDFEVRIYDDPDTPTTVVRTISVTGATASGGFFTTTYSNTDQIADFMQHQLRIAVSIRQVGSRKNSEWSEILTLDSGAKQQSVFLCHADGAAASTAFTDVYGKTLTANGNAQVTATSEFGTGAIACDGIGDYVAVSSSTDFATTTADMTAELFVRKLGTTADFARVLENAAFDSSTKGWQIRFTTGTMKIGVQLSKTGGGGAVLESTDSLTNLDYTHVAFVRRNNVGYLFVGGILQPGTLDLSAYSFDSQSMRIGASLTGDNSINGYIDEIRITANYARYTVDFTPPTSAFTE